MTNQELALLLIIIGVLLILAFILAIFWVFREYQKPKGGKHDHR